MWTTTFPVPPSLCQDQSDSYHNKLVACKPAGLTGSGLSTINILPLSDLVYPVVMAWCNTQTGAPTCPTPCTEPSTCLCIWTICNFKRFWYRRVPENYTSLLGKLPDREPSASRTTLQLLNPQTVPSCQAYKHGHVLYRTIQTVCPKKKSTTHCHVSGQLHSNSFDCAGHTTDGPLLQCFSPTQNLTTR